MGARRGSTADDTGTEPELRGAHRSDRGLQVERCEHRNPVQGYPVYGEKIGARAQGRPEQLLTGGVHGDEPAGVEAVLAQLEPPEALARQGFGFFIPCLNPLGYVENTRENVYGVDINRSMSVRA